MSNLSETGDVLGQDKPVCCKDFTPLIIRWTFLPPSSDKLLTLSLGRSSHHSASSVMSILKLNNPTITEARCVYESVNFLDKHRPHRAGELYKLEKLFLRAD